MGRKRLTTRPQRMGRSTAPNRPDEPTEEPQTQPAGSQTQPAGSQTRPAGSQTQPAGSQTQPAGSWLPPELADESVRQSRLYAETARWQTVAPLASRSSSTVTESDQDPSSSWLPPGEYEPEERVPKGQPDESGVEERAPMGQHAASGVEERPREHEPAAESAARDLPPATADATAEQEPAVEEEAVVTAEPDEAPTSRLPQFEPASDASAASPASVAAFAPSRRQTLAVGAYCRELCPPGTASAAAAESLTTFAGGDEHELLRYTRTIAARHAPVAPRRSRWHELVAAERESACQQTPGTVAALANGELSAAQGRALERHLKTCLTCQATEVRAGRASRAFAATAGIQLATDEQRPAPAEQRSSESAATSIQQPSLGSANAPQGVGK